MRELIYNVVESFYQKATQDILLGYHFDKFNDPEVLHEHLIRITSFWEMQLTGATTVPITGTPFRLLFTHLQLNIKRGELGRWIILFHQTLDEIPDKELVNLWKEKIVFFEERFKSHPQMFS
jgi:truncated hemoglobin YjbI